MLTVSESRQAAPGRRERLNRIGLPPLLGLITTLLAMAGSWIPSLWGDEAASVMSAQRSLPSLFRMLTHVDAVHGTYYLGLHFWIDAFGASPFSVRTPPAIAAGFAVASVVAIVQLYGGNRFALLAGIVTAVIPRVTYMGEETRSYAFSAAIAGWALWLLLRLLRDRGTLKRWWVAYAVLMALGIYVFLYFALFLVVHALVLLAVRPSRRTVRRWMLAGVIALVVSAPVIIFGLLEHDQVAFLAGETTTDPNSLLVGLWFTTPGFAILAWALIVVAIAFFVRDLVRGGPLMSLTFLGVIWLLVPGILLLGTNVLLADFTGRYLSYSSPAAGLLIIIAIRRIACEKTLPMAGLVVVTLVVATPAYLSQRQPYSKNGSDWAEISATVGAHAQAGDAVVFDESATPSRNPRLALHTYPNGFRGLRDVTLKTPYTRSSTWYDRTYTVPQAAALGRFRGVTHVWLIEYNTSRIHDVSGEAELRGLGFIETATFSTYHSRILEYTKP